MARGQQPSSAGGVALRVHEHVADVVGDTMSEGDFLESALGDEGAGAAGLTCTRWMASVCLTFWVKACQMT